MVALRSGRGGMFGLFGGSKPAKPSARGNVTAFKVGEKTFRASKGATPDLRRVVRLALESDVPFKK